MLWQERGVQSCPRSVRFVRNRGNVVIKTHLSKEHQPKRAISHPPTCAFPRRKRPLQHIHHTLHSPRQKRFSHSGRFQKILLVEIAT
ncbi:hypothetical protein TNCV_4071421 [Trichonephila clavipes]|uniref:Uncharacterized protein n=1 Tax=Trichonephila clavipes TaxID=2585209 RepID=A0A8X6W7Y5_TRICX|nr:hypothetical protein TNCV_4071421 [Trichonephila clavipes]